MTPHDLSSLIASLANLTPEAIVLLSAVLFSSTALLAIRMLLPLIRRQVEADERQTIILDRMSIRQEDDSEKIDKILTHAVMATANLERLPREMRNILVEYFSERGAAPSAHPVVRRGFWARLLGL